MTSLLSAQFPHHTCAYTATENIVNNFISSCEPFFSDAFHLAEGTRFLVQLFAYEIVDGLHVLGMESTPIRCIGRRCEQKIGDGLYIPCIVYESLRVGS